ncbi:hypothetical protein GALMADRAFT_1130535 [Galerina marginata CBS 339.88]|uniref:Uncharacterized protein n=1 Tax=Galerina marginata (strain CBS 339.88) TaxID=685588 RepID=A0A067SB34_GALM3|nr:hypothetical protein GALMADRAFT_1130535 [Galerina marginata CBS 339.88]
MDVVRVIGGRLTFICIHLWNYVFNMYCLALRFHGCVGASSDIFRGLCRLTQYVPRITSRGSEMPNIYISTMPKIVFRLRSSASVDSRRPDPLAIKTVACCRSRAYHQTITSRAAVDVILARHGGRATDRQLPATQVREQRQDRHDRRFIDFDVAVDNPRHNNGAGGVCASSGGHFSPP